MKKSIYLIILLIISACNINAQKLVDVYKNNETVNLIPDNTYAAGNNWNQVFDTYYDIEVERPIGEKKTLLIMDDGSALVSHAYRNKFSLFSPEGKFLKNIVIKDKSGKPIKKIRPILGIIRGEWFYTRPDNDGRMYFVDFDGNVVKELIVDYMVDNMFTLNDNKIVMEGTSLWKGNFRDFISILDIETGKSKFIIDWFVNYDLDKPGNILKRHYKRVSNPRIALIDNQIVVVDPTHNKVYTFDYEGNLKSKEDIKLQKKTVSVEEQMACQKRVLKRYQDKLAELTEKDENPVLRKNLQKSISNVEKGMDSITGPLYVSAFLTVLKDSDNNLLLFEDAEEEGENRFNVYIIGNKGDVICRSGFKSDKYELSIMPSKLVFHNGYLYGVQKLKEAEGIPLRLVRFKLN